MQKKSNHDFWALFAITALIIFAGLNFFGIRRDLIPNYLIFTGISYVSFFVVKSMKFDFFYNNYKLLYIVFFVLFILTFIMGEDIRGSKRWINIFMFNFHTSEFFKPFFLVMLAGLLSEKKAFSLTKISKIFLAAIVPMVIIFLQPDLGSTMLYAIVFVVMIFFAGSSRKFMMWLGTCVALFIPIGWMLMRPYQKTRIIGFINPDLDPQGLTYNLNQSIITIGSGGMIGKGLGLGTQARFRFLPEFQTDFAFASLIEQFGFIGGMIIFILFGILFYRLIKKIFESARERTHMLYLVGTTTFLCASFLINIGMNMGLMPVTGITLPFISYGGSSLVSTMIMLGIAFSIKE